RPAEGAGIGAATRPALLRLAGGPQQVAVHAPPLAPPAGRAAAPIVLPQPPRSTNREDTVGVGAAAPVSVVTPAWISRQGMRVLWSRFALYSLDSLLGFVDVAALNALATTIPEAALADTLSTRNLWKVAGDRLQATSLHWFPAVSLARLPAAVGPAAQSSFRRTSGAIAATTASADEVSRQGELMPIACGL